MELIFHEKELHMQVFCMKIVSNLANKKFNECIFWNPENCLKKNRSHVELYDIRLL